MSCSLSTIKTAACASGIAKEQGQIKLLQLIAQLTCEASQGAGAAAWGDITGTLANQADLQTILDQKPRVLTYANNVDVVGTGSSPFTLWSQTIPGGSLGPNGFLRCTYIATCNNDASVKQIGAYLSGTVAWTAAMTSTASVWGHICIVNRNSQSAQMMRPAIDSTAVNGISGAAPFTVAVNTAVDFTFSLRATLADVSDNVTLRAAFLEVWYMP